MGRKLYVTNSKIFMVWNSFCKKVDLGVILSLLSFNNVGSQIVASAMLIHIHVCSSQEKGV